jgi:hypothetical protein
MLRVPGDTDVPIYAKLAENHAWPDDPVFFLLTGEGLFLCRNHPFFVSSVPAPRWPAALATHEASLKIRYPRIPRPLLELAIGFFDAVYRRHGSEAGLLLAWDAAARRVELVCPPQVATVSRSMYGNYPIGLHYEIPDLGGRVLLGDLHSHGDEAAYASHVDRDDERTRGSGLHIVVGRLGDLERGGVPQIHIDAVTDGTRFRVAPELVLEGYEKPDANFPSHWLSQVKVESWSSSRRDADSRFDTGWYGSGSTAWRGEGPPADGRVQGDYR